MIFIKPVTNKKTMVSGFICTQNTSYNKLYLKNQLNCIGNNISIIALKWQPNDPQKIFKIFIFTE